MPYTRALKFQIPLMTGGDIVEVQLRLNELRYATGQPDGIFGSKTDAAIRDFQNSRSLTVDGVVGPLTWTELFKDTENTAYEKINKVLDELKKPHRFNDSIEWSLGPDGVVINGQEAETTPGEPETVRRVWQNFNIHIEEWSSKFGVPAELIIATICTESSGDHRAERLEPGYESDERTPGKVSIGLMQTLISTARNVLGDNDINRAWLIEPGNSIRAGTAYLALQWKATHFDPPKAGCAYNAGGVYYNQSDKNRWKMRQYPINTSAHADRFIKWFNDCFVMFNKDNICPSVSFFKLLTKP